MDSGVLPFKEDLKDTWCLLRSENIKLNFMLTKDKTGFQQTMQDCLIAWLV